MRASPQPDTVVTEAAPTERFAGRAWFLLALRVGLILVVTVVMWVVLRATARIESFPPSTTWATLGLLPVNVLCLLILRKFYKDEGVCLRGALGMQRGRIGQDVRKQQAVDLLEVVA